MDEEDIKSVGKKIKEIEIGDEVEIKSKRWKIEKKNRGNIELKRIMRRKERERERIDYENLIGLNGEEKKWIKRIENGGIEREKSGKKYIDWKKKEINKKGWKIKKKKKRREVEENKIDVRIKGGNMNVKIIKRMLKREKKGRDVEIGRGVKNWRKESENGGEVK